MAVVLQTMISQKGKSETSAISDCSPSAKTAINTSPWRAALRFFGFSREVDLVGIRDPATEKSATQHIRRLTDYGKIIKSIRLNLCTNIQVVFIEERSTAQLRVLVSKSFQKCRANIMQRKWMKQCISEFCIASSLDHPNVIRTLDLVLDQKNQFCTLMDYCPDGDLCQALQNGQLTDADINCYFKQLLHGLAYLHSVGVAHCDIKPENILLDGCILKISDFGTAQVFREPWLQEGVEMASYGQRGTMPYMAPEIFTNLTYDGVKADMWSTGIVFVIMLLGEFPFMDAMPSSFYYNSYCRQRPAREFKMFSGLDPEARDVAYRLLDPSYRTRLTAKQALELPFVSQQEMCTPSKKYHSHKCSRRH